MQKIDGTFFADGETLGYSSYLPQGMQRANILSLHGAGPAGRGRIDYLARHLHSHGYGTFCFDFSGHGTSTGKLSESSLARRIKQAEAAYQFIDTSIPTILMGTSMGGHISVEMLKRTKISHLILFCPALYGDEAANIPFDEKFSTSIRVSASYEHSSLIDVLKNYTGKSLILIGDKDDIIPPRVIDIYQEGLSCKGKCELVQLKNAPHVIHGWALQSEDNLKSVINPIDDFLANYPKDTHS